MSVRDTGFDAISFWVRFVCMKNISKPSNIPSYSLTARDQIKVSDIVWDCMKIGHQWFDIQKVLSQTDAEISYCLPVTQLHTNPNIVVQCVLYILKSGLRIVATIVSTVLKALGKWYCNVL